jgi:predicted unusual protein kinase regulating ubiquinone biosynthesis (AarF/ABC1/UbiB family)
VHVRMYTCAGRNADLFRENFAGVDWVKVPRVYWQYSSSEVLVLEYCPGTKINDAAALDAQVCMCTPGCT